MGQVEKNCLSCICLQCENGECMVSMCEGARVEPGYYENAIEQCYKEKCEHFVEEEDK